MLARLSRAPSLRFLFLAGWVALYALPVAMAVWLMLRFGVYAPSDHFLEFLPIIRRIALQGYPDAGQVMGHLNEHVPVTYHLLITAVGAVDIRLIPPGRPGMILFTWASVPLLLLAAWRLARIAAVTHAACPAHRRRMLTAVTLFLLFLPSRGIIWLQPYAAFVLTAVLGIEAIALLWRRPGSTLAALAAGACATASSFLVASGFGVWPAAVPLLLRVPGRRRRRILLAAWCLVACALFAVFVSLLPPWALGRMPRDPLRIATFLGTLLGAGFSRDWRVSCALGDLLCAGTAVALLRLRGRARVSALPWTCVFLCGFGLVLLIAVGRAGASPASALEGRYAVYAAVAWIGFLHLAALAIRRDAVFALLCAGVLALCLQSWTSTVRYAKGFSRHMRQAEACMRTYAIASDACLATLHFPWTPPESVRSDLRTMEELGLLRTLELPLVPAQPLPSDRVSGFLDGIDPHAPGTVMFWGWAGVDGCPAPHVLLTAGDHVIAHTTTVLPRGDVSPSGCMETSGWAVPVEPARAGLRPGDAVRAWVYDPEDGRMLPLGPEKIFPVLPDAPA